MRDLWLNEPQADLREARCRLVGLMADERARARDVASLEAQIVEFEEYARQALTGGKTDLAEEIAVRIVALERRLSAERTDNAIFTDEIIRLRSLVNRVSERWNEELDRRMQHRLDLLEAAIELQEGDSLIAKMTEAGIGPVARRRQDAQEILARIRYRSDTSVEPN